MAQAAAGVGAAIAGWAAISAPPARTTAPIRSVCNMSSYPFSSRWFVRLWSVSREGDELEAIADLRDRAHLHAHFFALVVLHGQVEQAVRGVAAVGADSSVKRGALDGERLASPETEKLLLTVAIADVER